MTKAICPRCYEDLNNIQCERKDCFKIAFPCKEYASIGPLSERAISTASLEKTINLNQQRILAVCAKEMALPLDQAAQMLFNLSIQMKYAQFENLSQVAANLLNDGELLAQWAHAAFRNNQTAREKGQL